MNGEESPGADRSGRLKVRLVVNGYPDARNPHGGIYNARTARDLARLVDLTVLVPRAWKPGRPFMWRDVREGVEVVSLAWPVVPRHPRLTLRLSACFGRRRCVEEFKRADLVHSVGLEFNGVLCARWTQGLSCGHVTQVINNLLCLRAPPFDAYPYVDGLPRGVDGVICNSRSLEALALRFVAGVQKLRTIYRGVDLATFHPGREPLGFQADLPAPRFLYLGGLPEYRDRQYGLNTKGGLTLMQAWREAERELAIGGASLVFAGPDADGAIAKCWHAGLASPQVVHLAGMVKPEEVPGYLCAADVVIVPSLEEGFPNLAFEAAGCGRPLLASSIGPLAEVVDDGENGFLVAPGDVRAWRHALLRCVASGVEPLLRRLGEAGREKAVRKYDRHRYAPELVRFYVEVLNSRRPSLRPLTYAPTSP